MGIHVSQIEWMTHNVTAITMKVIIIRDSNPGIVLRFQHFFICITHTMVFTIIMTHIVFILIVESLNPRPR